MTLLIVGLFALLGGSLIAWGVLCIRSPANGVIGILALVIFSPHVLAALYAAGLPASWVRAGIGVKDLACVVLLISLVVTRKPSLPKKATLAWTALGIVVLLYYCVGVGKVGIFEATLGLRDAGAPVVGLVTALLLGSQERTRVLRAFVILAAIAAAYALVEYVLPISYLKNVLKIGQYWSDVKRQPGFLFAGLPGNFLTSSGSRRLSGTFGDPLTAGYLLGLAAIACLSRAVPRSLRFLAPALIVPALVLTFTRAGWILALCGAAAILWFRLPRSRRAPVILAASGLVALTIVFVAPISQYALSIVQGRDSSTLAHLEALGRNLHRGLPLTGNGFGTAGAAVAAQETDSSIIGTESVWATMGLQVGLLGLGAIVISLAVAIGRLLLARWSDELVWALAGIGAAVLLSMTVSEQILTFSVGWTLCLVTALGPFALGSDETVPVETVPVAV